MQEPVQGPSITLQEPTATVSELEDRLLTEFERWLPQHLIAGMLRGYLERYGVDPHAPSCAATTLTAVERATRLALAARVASSATAVGA